jgi:hypothetical protein
MALSSRSITWAVKASTSARVGRLASALLKFPHREPEFSCSINDLRWMPGLGF